MQNLIRIKGARQHNLKNISLELPKNKLVVFTGLSGSGKSSLAFDTIYAEGQRRYVESLSAYARQFLGVMDKPDVDAIEGLSPAISIDQKSTSHNPRSTVGTVTEIHDYLRLLFARVGHPHCPSCGREISRMSVQQIVDLIQEQVRKNLKNPLCRFFRFLILAPVVRDRKGEFSGLFDNLRAKGYHSIRVDGHFFEVDEDILLIKTNKHTIDVVVDRVSVDRKTLKQNVASLRRRLSEAVEQSLALSNGLVIIGHVQESGFDFPAKPKVVSDHILSEKFACPVCNISLPEVEPRTFSFNSPHGACPQCNGIGHILTVDSDLVLRKELSITEGGIIPFAKMFFHDTWFARLMLRVAQKYGIDARGPLSQLTAAQNQVLLYGTKDELHRVSGTNRFGEMTAIEETFAGVIPELKRRYNETESDFIRTEIEKYMRQEVCSLCQGKRLKQTSLTITVAGFSIADVSDLSIRDTLMWVSNLLRDKPLLSVQETTIASPIVKEIKTRLQFLVSVGLDYLTLSRSATTLAGGEAQRIRLASQIGSGLTGVLYVLDEPSIGLHPKDNDKLIATLKQLRDLGNTVIVVEHDKDMMEAADYLVDFGPGAGGAGGKIVATGTVAQVKNNPNSLTAKYLRGVKVIHRPNAPKPFPTIAGSRELNDHNEIKYLTLQGASEHNLKQITVSFPLGKFIVVSGVSGSGKSTLVVETLYWALYNHFNLYSKVKPGAFTGIEGVENIDKVILIDQSPIGRTPRSNPATYTGVFTYIRAVFSLLPTARSRGYTPGRFSFNVSAKGGSASGGKGGRCEACEGEGQIKIEMQFMADIYVTCQVCAGTRYNSETLEVTYRDKNIAQILEMTVDEALLFFANYHHIHEKLKTLADVGLGYIHLGQAATTLSGGEAQRVKLAAELARRATGSTVYILDEPTTGLHFADLEKLLGVLHRLTAVGNTVIVIEHNLDMIRNADWILDLGPDGGEAGGEVVASGTPRELAMVKLSYTGKFLRTKQQL